jgi:ribosomal protein S4
MATLRAWRGMRGLDVAMPAWLERRDDGHQVQLVAEPTRDQIHVPANEMMVVELYSR